MTRWLNLIFILLLGGCAKYQPRPISPGQLETNFRSRSLAETGLRDFFEKNLNKSPSSWPPKEFNLELLTLTAFYFHPDLEMARAKIQTAKAGEIAAGERPNPSAALTPTFAPNAAAGVAPWLLGFSWDIPIETAGKRGHRLSQAKQTTRAAQLELGETAWKIRSHVRSGLLEHVIAQREAALWQKEITSRTNLLQMLEKRREFGEVSRVEVNQAQSELLNAQLAFRATQGRVTETRVALAASIGLPASALREIKFAWPKFDQLPTEKTISATAVQGIGLLNRLDIRRALSEYAATEAALQLEISKQYPDVHLSPGYEFDQGDHKFSLGASLTLPILNQNQGAIAQAEAKRQESAASFSALQSQVIGETEKAFAGFHSALAEWNDANALLKTVQSRAEEMARRAVTLGESDRVSSLNVQLQGASLARARLDSLRKVHVAIGALEDAVQRPVSGDDNALALQIFSKPESAEQKRKTK